MEHSVPSTRTVPNPAARLRPADILELLKPITWVPPMWAFMCGAVSSGAGLEGRWWFVAGGVLLAGPLVCGTSQAVNDWYDRHVDAINEPQRPIPAATGLPATTLDGKREAAMAIGFPLLRGRVAYPVVYPLALRSASCLYWFNF